VSDVPQADASEISEDDLRSGKTIRLTEEDDGASFKVTQGQTIVVKLPQNAGTGFAWQVKSVSRTLGQPTITYKPNAGTDPRIGGGGFAILTWKTNSPLDMTGTHQVKLEYRRSWESPSKPAAGTFTFTAKIAKSGPVAPPKLCKVSGCSGEICAAENRFSTCVFSPWMGCVRGADCEVQADGECGFSLSASQKTCMSNNGR
jgi:predicted secreted protein